MSPHPIHHRPKEQKPGQKRTRSNVLRQAQVLPPHKVDLTLQPATHEDVHVPAHVSGADLSREAPGDANHGGKNRGRSK
ncbi:hypothetical protein [Rhizobium leucaenae]|uniref:Uncharacterized protein n=1 Tax=Rhizobium leucaenae TaxID=29450 RepID=A0A7W6ZPV8_9HYPH|nr:hypothetical protein [Rhizobium leucaenae]MBB4566514.1 hypothetical protein [Rhizobium leucaenae]MBB6301592.1 hypothetical protein [Rhizobium leucaenae]